MLHTIVKQYVGYLFNVKCFIRGIHMNNRKCTFASVSIMASTNNSLSVHYIYSINRVESLRTHSVGSVQIVDTLFPFSNQMNLFIFLALIFIASKMLVSLVLTINLCTYS